MGHTAVTRRLRVGKWVQRDAVGQRREWVVVTVSLGAALPLAATLVSVVVVVAILAVRCFSCSFVSFPGVIRQWPTSFCDLCVVWCIGPTTCGERSVDSTEQQNECSSSRRTTLLLSSSQQYDDTSCVTVALILVNERQWLQLK